MEPAALSAIALLHVCPCLALPPFSLGMGRASSVPLSPYLMSLCPPQVKLAFSEGRALPGSQLNLQVQAAPGSLCAVRAVDQSVLLMKPETELSTDTVSHMVSLLQTSFLLGRQNLWGLFLGHS